MRSRKRLRSALVSVLIGAIATTGCTQLPLHARQQLIDADRAYRTNDTAGAIAKLDGVLRDYPNTPESAEAYYIRALCHAKAGRTAEARSDLERCLGLSAREDLSARAAATLGGLEYDAGDYEAAIGTFERALPHLPAAPPTDLVMHRHGIALQRLGRWKDARAIFASLLESYPSSEVAEDARRRFSWKQQYFSVQCGAFERAASADELIRKLSGTLADAWKEPEARHGRPLYVVYAGQYPRYADAQNGLRQVRKIVPGAFIVP